MTINHRGIGLGVAACLGFICLAWGQSPAAGELQHKPSGHMHPHISQHPAHYPGEHMIEGMLAELDLSPEQESSIRDLMERDKARLRDLHATMRDSRRSVMALETTDPVYSQTLAEASETAGRALTEIMQVHGQLRAEIQALLTSEQRELARELRQRMHERMQARMARPLERPPAAFIF